MFCRTLLRFLVTSRGGCLRLKAICRHFSRKLDHFYPALRLSSASTSTDMEKDINSIILMREDLLLAQLSQKIKSTHRRSGRQRPSKIYLLHRNWKRKFHFFAQTISHQFFTKKPRQRFSDYRLRQRSEDYVFIETWTEEAATHTRLLSDKTKWFYCLLWP